MTLLSRTPQSFLPVVERSSTSRGTVVGIIRVLDLFARPDAPVSRLMVEPARLPARMTLRDAVLRLRQAPLPVGVVEDSGRPVGLVTLSDLIEPLLRPDE